MSSWDRRPPAAQSKAAATALRTQVVDVVGPFSPFWRERLQTLGRTAVSVATPDGTVLVDRMSMGSFETRGVSTSTWKPDAEPPTGSTIEVTETLGYRHV